MSLFVVFVLVSGCSTHDPKFQQYYAQGQVLYEKHCSNCHQKTGQGLGRVYPPLASSDYLDANFEKLLCLMKYGVQGEIVVNGKSFNKPMPAIPSLTELEIAEITTYIGNSWGSQQGLIDVTKASKILGSCTH
ncbi:MAG: cytochrome c [Bacteroidetes bacterium]|nr:cytochrome c [Bacteroidota bacterium]